MGTVDVIIPCYGYGRYLEQCVRSILAEPVPPVRVLIIDDASPDNTREVAEELVRADRRVMYVRHTSNKGHIATYNEGIDWASSEYLLLLSADDFLLPGALSRSAQFLDEHQELSFVFGNTWILWEDGRRTPVMPFGSRSSGNRTLTFRQFFEASGARNIVGTPSAVVRTALQKRIGGYRPELPHTGDMEMWLRLAMHGSVGFVNAPQAVYRRHGANMSASYTLESKLPDLHHRKAAIDWFFAHDAAVLPDCVRLKERTYALLAQEAVGFASAAVDADQSHAVNELLEFARSLSPAVNRSWPWAKLVLKRRIGARTWQVMRRVFGTSQ